MTTTAPRLVTPAAVDSERHDVALRPKRLQDFVGQEAVRSNLGVFIQAAKGRGQALDHVLLSGPPGLGKTTLAEIVARELDVGFRATSGPVIARAGDLAALLTNLQPHDVLFIDEIHRMAKSAEEMLYLAMEDFRIDVMVGKGPGAASISLEIAPFTLVGATTRSGVLASPLRDRFGFTANLEFYSDVELEMVVSRAAEKLRVDLQTPALQAIASRSRGTPRVANRLLRRVRDFALVNGFDLITVDVANEALELYEVDALGLDRLDRQELTLLCTSYSGRAVGLATIAVSLGEEQETIEGVVEPFLVRTGLVVRTPKGREATAKAFEHLGLSAV